MVRAPRVIGRAAAVAVVLGTALSGVQLAVLLPAAADTTDVIPSANPIDITPRILDKQARSIVQVGDRMVVGGNFTQIQNAGSPTVVDQPYVFAFDAVTGKIDTNFLPSLNGEVTTVLPHPDGDKVWVAGAFSQANGDMHSRIVLLNLSTGQAVSSFDPPAISAEVSSMKLVGDRLYIGGEFKNIGSDTRTALATLDPASGAVTTAMNSTISGSLQAGKGVTGVKTFDVSPDGSRLVAIGNFAQVDGKDRVQLAMWDTSGPTATLQNWATQRLGDTCNPVFPTYVRGIDISPDGKFFVVVTTGSYRSGQLCDTASRWEMKGSGPDRTPTWVTYTGGDTLTTVEVTGPMAYLGGHMRWLNNPYKGDAAGSGAWPTEGLAIVDTRNGLPFSWNPGRERGLGVFDFLPTESMLWAVSDTNTWAGEFRQRLAAFPVADGFSLPPDEIGRLPGDVWQLGAVPGGAADDQRVSGFDGTAVNAQITEPGDQSWGTVTGAFAVDGTVYAAWDDDTFTAQSFDGSTFGTPTVIDLYAGDPSTPGYTNNFVNDLASITGMFYDRSRARIYYTTQGSAALFWRPFTPESQVVGAARRMLLKAGALSPKRVQGMFLTGGQLYFADRTTGSLKRIEFRDNRLVGTAAVVNEAIDWRANALLLSSQWATVAPNPAPVAAFTSTCGGLTCDVDASRSSDADGGVVDYSVDYGDGTVLSGVKTQHTYADDGTYTITITVTDNRGESGNKSRGVSVARPANIDPSAALSIDCWGLDCDMDASASTDSDGGIVTYDWDFGDTATASGQTANHVFATGGTYPVTVTVTDDRGGVDTASQELTVSAIPTSIAFRAAGSADGGNGNLPSAAVPAATQVGDLMLLFISNGTDRTADTPSGWDGLGTQSDDELRTQVFWRFATAADLGTVVSARLRDAGGLAQAAPNTATMAVYSGVDTPPVVDASSAAEPTLVNGGVTDHTTPQITVPADGQWVVSYWADRTASLSTAWTAPSGESFRADAYSSGSISRVSSVLTDGGGPTLAGIRGGLTAAADGDSRKATMWSIVLRSQ
ncbi:MAG: PKD domain-containing protein [Actinomycetia bacterium]|nr:PKD domain-containing protein [Actinomycetes bacterium]